ncbi:MAG TPA: TRAP transporter substrate-binding protein [Stellaceae bacterium]|jgi:TRAP-type C4-dicarboxylate transport system substrate-binding protein
MSGIARSLLVAAGLFVATVEVAAADPVVLRFAPLASPGQANYEEFYKPWADRVTGDSQGALTIELRGGNAIASNQNIYDRVMSDVVQMGFVLFNYVAGKFPFAEVGALPNLADTSEHGSDALWRLYQSGTLDSEFDQAKPLMLIALPQSIVHLTKPPKSLKDLTGERIVGPTQLTALAAQYMGAQPITLSSPEAYEAMNRGTADGTILSWNVYYSFKIGEVAHYHIDQPMGTAAGMIFMSRKRYDALPAAAKETLDRNSGQAASRAWGKWWDSDNNHNREAAKADPKQTVVTLDPETRAAWQKRLDGAIAEWAKSRPGVEKVIVQYRQLLAEAR